MMGRSAAPRQYPPRGGRLIVAGKNGFAARGKANSEPPLLRLRGRALLPIAVFQAWRPASRPWHQPQFRPHSAYVYTAAAAQRSWRAAAAVWLIRLGCYPHGSVPRGTHSPYTHTHTHCTPYQPGIYNTMYLPNHICHPFTSPRHTRLVRGGGTRRSYIKYTYWSKHATF